MRHATILGAILAFVPIASTAQETSMSQVPLRPGERVRVTYHLCPPTLANCFGGRALRVGTLVTWNADTLVVDNNGDTLAVPLDIVTELKVSRRLGLSRNGAAKGAAIGGVLLYAVSRSPAASAFGAGVGALLGSGPSARKGAGNGFLIGGAIGFVLGLASGDDPPGWFSFTAGEKAAIGAVAFGFIGAVIGSIAGAASPGDRWEEVPLDRLRVSFRPQRDGRFAFGASVKF